ncbi:MAG: secretin N-terminal domain-containing protein [Thermoguttaceae bacterium]
MKSQTNYLFAGMLVLGIVCVLQTSADETPPPPPAPPVAEQTPAPEVPAPTPAEPVPPTAEPAPTPPAPPVVTPTPTQPIPPSPEPPREQREMRDATPNTSSPNTPPEQRKLRFNFRHQPYKDVVEWFAEQAGLSLEIASFPAGTFNYSDPNTYSPQEALDIINSVLLFKEYTLVRKGRMLFVLNLQDGIPANLLEPITPEELANRGKYELVRCIWTLTRTTPDVIQAEVERMLGPQGSIVALPKSQQILITETAGTLRAIDETIKRIDDPLSASVGNIQTVSVKNITADEALLSMRKLLAVDENDPSLRAIVDATGLKIWLSGRPDMVEKAKTFLAMIDESYTAEKPEGQPQVEIFDTGTADPTTVMAVLQTLLVGIPDVRLSLDPKTAAIVARGRLPEMATIKATISQMQVNAEQVVSIPLSKMSAQSAVDALRKIFPKPTTTSGTTATVVLPIIEADAAGRAVIVKGTPVHIAQVREALLTLGETGLIVPANTDTRTIRTVTLPPAAAAYVLEQIQTVWPTLNANELKVVTPSAMIPSRIPTNSLPSKADIPSRQPAPQREREIDGIIDGTLETRPPHGGGPGGGRGPRGDGPPMTMRLPEVVPVHGLKVASLLGGSFFITQRHGDTGKNFNAENAEGRKDTEVQSSASSVFPRVPRSRLRASVPPCETPQKNGERLPEVKLHFVVATEDDKTNDAEVAELRETLRKLQARLEQIESSKTNEVQTENAATTPAAPVVVSVGPSGLMLTSSDPEALGRLESLVRLLSDPTVLDRTTLTIYYLKHSTADVVAQTIQSIMGTSGLGRSVDGIRLEDETLSQALGLLGAGDSYEATGTVKVMAEPRLNALMIQANAVDHRTIEKLLPILDQPDIPGGDPLNRPRPHMIVCTYIKADEAMSRVKEVFADKIQGSSGGGGSNAAQRNTGGNNATSQRGSRGTGNTATAAPAPQGMTMPPMIPGMMPGGGGPGGFLQAMMQQMGGGGGGNSSRAAREADAKMTLSTDQRSNSLIVYAPDSLAAEVTTFVRELDDLAGQTETVVESYQLNGVGMTTLRQVLGNAAGDSVNFSTTSQSSTSRGAVDLTTNFGAGTSSRGGSRNTGAGATGFPRIGGAGGGMFPFGGFGGAAPGGMSAGGFGGQRSTLSNPAGGGARGGGAF